MRVALLKGNRFNPWHLQGFARLPGRPEVVAFRAESEIQRYFSERDDGSAAFALEPIYFDTQAGPLLARLRNRLLHRWRGREPRIRPFHERLRGFDLVQSWELFTDWSAEALEARRRWGIPLAVMVWDNIPFNMEMNPRRRAIKQAVAREADRFIVHTERSRRTLCVEGVDPARITMIDPGVDVQRFSPGAGSRATFGLEPDDFVIVFVGWLLPRKGIDFLLLALRELLHDPGLASLRPRLLVVGSGPGKDRVDRLVDRLGVRDACRFAGSLPYSNMPEAFRCGDAFVLPSIATPEWQEQFGMSLIEAMACGIPVVSTYSGAIPEVLGDAGILCQPNDFLALFEAIKQLMCEPVLRADWGARARARAEARFTLDGFAAALGEVYRELTAAPRD